MTGTGLILAAHGSNAESATNELIRSYADRVRRMSVFDEVTAAFHKGYPGFCTALTEMSADHVTVVPVMTSAGHFCRVILPGELSKSARYASVRVRQVRPVGTHPGIVPLVERRVGRLLTGRSIPPDDVSIVIVGHGTDRHKGSCEATVVLADSLRVRSSCDDVLPAYLDEEPFVESVSRRARHGNIVVLPFLIGCGVHSVRDLPRRLGFDPASDVPFPAVRESNGRVVICDSPIGTDPAILDIILDLAGGKRQMDGERMIA